MFDAKRFLNKKIFINILETMVLAAVACLTISEFGGYYLIITTVGTHSKLLMEIAFSLFAIKIMLTRYTKKEFLTVFVLIFLGYINYKRSGNTEIITSAVMILSLKNVSLKKVFTVCFYSLIGIVALLGILSVLGIAGDLSITKDFGRGGVETRYVFGFYHPNQWAHAVFMILLCGMLSFWERMDWKCGAAMLVVNLVIYKLAASRTAFLCGMVLILMMLLYKHCAYVVKSKTWNRLLVAGCAAVWMFSLYLVKNSAGVFWNKLDRLFTGRISLGREFMTIYSPTVWGEKIADMLENGHVLDFGYIRFFLENGVIIYGLMIAATFLIGIYAVNKGRYEILVVLASITLYGIYENIAMRMTPANMIMVFFSLMIYERGFFSEVSKKALTIEKIT